MQPNACTTRKIQEEMTRPSDTRHPNDLPPELVSILKSALQVGGLAGRRLSVVYIDGILVSVL